MSDSDDEVLLFRRKPAAEAAPSGEPGLCWGGKRSLLVAGPEYLAQPPPGARVLPIAWGTM